MISPFNDVDRLPPGIRCATMNEIAERFGSESEVRRVQMKSPLKKCDVRGCRLP